MTFIAHNCFMYPAELTFEFAIMHTVPLKLVYAFHRRVCPCAFMCA